MEEAKIQTQTTALTEDAKLIFKNKKFIYFKILKNERSQNKLDFNLARVLNKIGFAE